MTDRQFDLLMIRLVTAVEKLAGIEPPVERPKPPLTEAQRRKDLVSVVRRGETPPAWDGSGLPPGGGDVTPTDFWARRDQRSRPHET